MKNIISRRHVERTPREGYTQTLQLSLIPAVKVNIVFWLLMALISIIIAYMLKDHTVGTCLHGTLTIISTILTIKYFIEFKRLKKILNNILKLHPEFKI